MIIKTQNTPDINILNFFPSQKLLMTDQAEFIDSKSLRHSPLAENLFDLGGIKSILITSDMISVTKENTADWETLKPQILAEIMDFLTSGEEIIIRFPTPEQQEDIIPKIIGLIEARIKPALKKDGGSIKFHSFENNVVYVELLGNCAGCPYASHTLKEGVEKILKTYIPQVLSVKNIKEKDD